MLFSTYLEGVRCNESKTIQLFVWDHVRNSAIAGVISIHVFVVLAWDLARGGGGHSLVMGYRGCAAGWGRIFTTRLTIMESPFQAFSIELIE